MGVVEKYGFLRQPFERGVGRDIEHDVLPRYLAIGLVPLGGARCGDESFGLQRDVGRDRQLIAADHAARRMHDDRVADFGAFGIQRLLHAQGAEVGAFDQARCACVGGEA